MLNPEQAYQGYSFSQVADLWLFMCQKRFERTTCRDKAHVINSLMEHWGYDPVISKVTTLSIEEFLNSLPGKTANRYKRELSTFFNFAIKREILKKNPLKSIEKYKEEQYKRYVPPAEAIEAVKAVSDELEYDVITMAYHTLARAGEIRALKWEDVDLEKRNITLWTSKRKGGRKEDDTLDMTDTLYEMLSIRSENKEGEYVFYYRGKPLKKWWVNDFLPKLCKKAEVEHFSLHGIRHHVAALISYKLSLIQVSKILRHRNLTTTDIYLRSIVKIETQGIKVLDELSKPTPNNVISFVSAANGK